MKVLAILTFMLAIFAAPAYAQQKGTVSFNGNVFDAPSAQGAGLAQSPGSTQPPAKA
jgi:type 1 fimbria pilin